MHKYSGALKSYFESGYLTSELEIIEVNADD